MIQTTLHGNFKCCMETISICWLVLGNAVKACGKLTPGENIAITLHANYDGIRPRFRENLFIS